MIGSRTGRRVRRLAALGAVLALVAVGAACGDDDDGNSGNGDGNGSGNGDPAAGLSGEPIKIGIAWPETGDQAGTFDDAMQVTRGWADWVNTNGGIDDNPVELLERDTATEAATAQSVVSDLVENEGVVAMLFLDSASEDAVGEYLNDQGVPLLGIGYSIDIYGALPNAFGITTSIPATVQMQVVSAAESDAEGFSAMSCAESPACAQAELIYEPTSEALGLSWDGLATVAASAPNYTAECLSLIDRGTDFIQLSIGPAVASRVAPDCLSQDFEGTFGASAGNVVQADLDEVSGGRFAGGLYAFPWWADAPPAAEYREMAAEFAGEADAANGNATALYATLELFRSAMVGVTDISPAGAMAAMTSVSDETLDGLLPQPMTFTAGEPAPPVTCFWLYRYEVGGDFELIAPTAPSGNGVAGDLATSCFPPNE